MPAFNDWTNNTFVPKTGFSINGDKDSNLPELNSLDTGTIQTQNKRSCADVSVI